MNLTVRALKAIKGEISLPGDKSIAHRALILTSLAQGKSFLQNIHLSGVIQATINCLKMLGVQIEIKPKNSIYIYGQGLKGLKEPNDILYAGNSGTTMRLLAGVLSGHPFVSILNGTEQLKTRPMGRVVEPLRRMGALILARGGNYAPLTISGAILSPIDYTMPIPSAQVKSALLFAGLYTNGESRIIEPIPSRDHSERLLKEMKAPITIVGNEIKISPPDQLSPLEMKLPGDISSAAFFIAAAVLLQGSHLIIKDIGLNPRRLGFIRVLQQMGAKITLLDSFIQNGEPRGHLEVKYSSLTAPEISETMVPYLIDEIPILAVVATQAVGTTIIRNLQELRYKESDRLKSITDGLTRLGAQITEESEGLIIKGPTKLKGAVCDSYNDHRIAMALAIAGTIARGRTIIKNAECINESFPGFEKLLHRVGNVRRKRR